MSSNAHVACQQQEILSMIIKFVPCETSLAMTAPSWTQAATAIKFEIISRFLSETVKRYVSEIHLESRLQRLIKERLGERRSNMLDATSVFWCKTQLHLSILCGREAQTLKSLTWKCLRYTPSRSGYEGSA